MNFDKFFEGHFSSVEMSKGVKKYKEYIAAHLEKRVAQLKSIGMTDENLIEYFATFELGDVDATICNINAGKHFKKIRQKKIVAAEMWDRMQFLFRNFYDRMVHLRFTYDGVLSADILKNALVYMIERTPVLHSAFVQDPIAPFWKVKKYTIDDIFSCEHVDDVNACADEWLRGKISFRNNVQIKVAMFENGAESAVAIRINHMCMDGGDGKYFVRMLCRNYNAIKTQNYQDLHIKTGSRSFKQVYSKFEGEDLKTAKGLYKNIAVLKDQVAFPWSKKDKKVDCNRIVKRTFDEDVFFRMKAVSKHLGVTINDAVMAIVFRSLYEICGVADNGQMAASCAIDLRKHIVEGGELGGLTNHTAWMALRTMQKGASIEDTVKDIAQITNRYKSDKFLGLYSLPLLNLGFTIFPPALSEFAIKLGYSNPLIAVSNIGPLDAKALAFDGCNLIDGFMTGAVKYKPFFLMSLTTLLNKITLSTAIRGSEKDVEIANNFFDVMSKNIDEFNAIAFE